MSTPEDDAPQNLSIDEKLDVIRVFVENAVWERFMLYVCINGASIIIGIIGNWMTIAAWLAFLAVVFIAIDWGKRK